jgi:hypothetical protein
MRQTEARGYKPATQFQILLTCVFVAIYDRSGSKNGEIFEKKKSLPFFRNKEYFHGMIG